MFAFVSPMSGEAQCVYDNQGRRLTKKQRQKAKSDAPLIRAIVHGDKTTFESLLKSKLIDVNARDCESGTTALMETIISNEPKMMSALIARKANVNLRNHSGFTALMYAAGYGRSEAVQELLLAGADVNAKIKGNGWTALSIASRYSTSIENQSVVKILKANGAIE